MTPAPPIDGARSVQGEQLLSVTKRQYADLAFVDQYARTVSDGIRICRERNRHRYAPVPRSRPFDGRSPSGYLVRHTDPCLDCGCAIQIQRYEPYLSGRGRNQEVRVRPAYNTTAYQENEYGETYPTKDHGHIHPRDFRDSVATDAVNMDPTAQAEVAAALELRAAWTAKHPS